MRFVALLGAALMLLTACEPITHYNRIKVAGLTGAPVEVPHNQRGKVKPYGSVKLLEEGAVLPQKSKVIAIMTLEGEAGDEARFITAFLYRAADLGADAIILHCGGLVPKTKTQFGGGLDTKIEAVYRAEAIRLPSGSESLSN